LFTIEVVSDYAEVYLLTDRIGERFFSQQIIEALYNTNLTIIDNRSTYIQKRIDILNLKKNNADTKKASGTDKIARLAQYKNIKDALQKFKISNPNSETFEKRRPLFSNYFQKEKEEADIALF
jgi:hypothetical protein